MKRLEQLYTEMKSEIPFVVNEELKPYILELVQVYAREVAQASLEKAAENAKIEKEYSIRYQDFIPDSVDKESITNEYNIVML